MKSTRPLVGITLDIDTTKRQHIRDLKPGQFYIRTQDIRKPGGISPMTVRVRMEDPYRSETYLGTPINSYPSEAVYIVTVHEQKIICPDGQGIVKPAK